MKKMITMLAVLGMVLALAPAAHAQIPVPAGLNPGDTYHLIFVTSTSRDATSSNVADYNTFVQGVADAEGIGASEGVSWYAVASTDTVDANANAVVSADVYLVDGTLVASSAAFYTPTHAAAINLKEDGTGASGDVWSGSLDAGTVNTLGGHSGLGGAAGKSISGRTGYSGSGWLQGTWNTTHGTAQPFYAISEELTVGGGGSTPGTLIYGK